MNAFVSTIAIRPHFIINCNLINTLTYVACDYTLKHYLVGGHQMEVVNLDSGYIFTGGNKVGGKAYG
jgi:hypothetical protein